MSRTTHRLVGEVFLGIFLTFTGGLVQARGDTTGRPDTWDKKPTQEQLRAEERDSQARAAAILKLSAEHAEDDRVKAAGGQVLSYTSPEKWSGAGQDFSDWYLVESPPPPSGYVLSSCVFHLVGGRVSCGQWAKCEAVVRPNGTVQARFATQGHNENQQSTFKSFDIVLDHGPMFKVGIHTEGRKVTSVGLLKARYMKSGASAAPAKTCLLADYDIQ